MSGSGDHLRPAREPRYLLGDSPGVVITIASNAAAPGPSYDAYLKDLSQHGAKLSCVMRIPLEESTRLRLAIDQLGMQFSVGAEVCWSKVAGSGFEFGCTLDPGLPEELFEALVDGGKLDRRFVPRLRSYSNWPAEWDHHGCLQGVTLQEYSEGGFCVVSPQPGNPGQAVHVRFPELKTTFAAKCQWQLKVVDGYLFGCSYQDPRDFLRLESAIAAGATRARALMS